MDLVSFESERMLRPGGGEFLTRGEFRLFSPTPAAAGVSDGLCGVSCVPCRAIVTFRWQLGQMPTRVVSPSFTSKTLPQCVHGTRISIQLELVVMNGVAGRGKSAFECQRLDSPTKGAGCDCENGATVTNTEA